jgi:hypothetical protein
MPIKFHEEYHHFATWGEFVDYVRQDAPNAHGHSSKDGGYSFTGTRSYEEAIELADNGWAEGRDEALKMSQPLIDRLVQFIERPDIVYDVEGNGYDIGRFCSDDPECAIRMENEIVEVPAPPRLIRIVFNNLASAGVDKEILTAKGAAVAALIELLEFAGNRVELVVLSHASGDSSRERIAFMKSVTVKAFDQPLDMARIIFAIAHPAMMRRLGFRVAELASPVAQRAMHVGGGYGYVVSTDQSELLAEYNLRPDLFFAASYLYDTQWGNEKATQKWVLETLKAQGVHINEEALNNVSSVR